MGNILVAGIIKKFSKGYLDIQHLTYDLMISKKVVPKYKKGKSYVIHNNKNIDLANLCTAKIFQSIGLNPIVIIFIYEI